MAKVACGSYRETSVGAQKMKKWLKRIGIGSLVVVLLFCAVTYVRFALWRRDVTKDLARDSTVVQTAKGPIEYAELGHGPPVLMIHGTPGGYDQMYQGLKLDHAEHGDFRYIIPSRPGYLRTPLSVGRTPREQAEAFAALLDILKIDKVAVLGGSGGGPSAIEFAARYPDRCVALVLEEAVSMQWNAGKPGFLEAAINNTVGHDFGVWLIKDQFAASFQATNPADPEITAVAMAVFNSTVPYANREAGVQNDAAQYAQISTLPLASIRCPTLLVHGTADVTVPIAHSELAHAQIAGSQFVQLPGQDHWMVMTKHKELGELTHSFLVEHTGD
jgi:pimeloyl-ACP methyl ester carboxylesterase